MLWGLGVNVRKKIMLLVLPRSLCSVILTVYLICCKERNSEQRLICSLSYLNHHLYNLYFSSDGC